MSENWTVIGASSFTGRHFVAWLRERGDVVQESSLRHPLPPWRGPDGPIVNFAAMNLVAESWVYPQVYCDVNVRLFVSVLNWVVSTGCRYIHISTPEIYGSTSGSLTITEDHPFNPSTPYAVTRAAQEMMLKVYGDQYGLDYRITRACNVYGPYQQLWRLIPKLIVSIKEGRKFPLEGGGQSVRSFIHVDDVCRAIYAIATKGRSGEAYHIAPMTSYSILGIVEMICKMLDKDPKDVIKVVPERPGKDAAYRLNSAKLRALGWEDEVDLDDGIIDVIDWINTDWKKVQQMPREWKP